MKKHKASFGSISSGTMRPEDLIPAFADELRWLRGSLPRSIYSAIKWHTTQDELNDVVDLLMDALNEYAPPYAYFGAHPGDGADYGFWLHEGFDQDFDGLKVSDTSEVPSDYSGEVLHVNDHGNCTLYAARKGKLTEVWAVV